MTKPLRPMTDKQCREEILACIAFYDRKGWNWLSAVGFLTFQHLFDAVIAPRGWGVSRPRVGRPRRRVG